MVKAPEANATTTRYLVAVVAVGLATALSACSVPTAGSGGPAPGDEEVAEAPASLWECSWDPTMNDDWHDDVVCSRGFDTVRPILLPDQGFVTEDEMRAAGEAYEAELNAGE